LISGATPRCLLLDWVGGICVCDSTSSVVLESNLIGWEVGLIGRSCLNLWDLDWSLVLDEWSLLGRCNAWLLSVSLWLLWSLLPKGAGLGVISGVASLVFLFRPARILSCLLAVFATRVVSAWLTCWSFGWPTSIISSSSCLPLRSCLVACLSVFWAAASWSLRIGMSISCPGLVNSPLWSISTSLIACSFGISVSGLPL
jgi:hypothetical protein